MPLLSPLQAVQVLCDIFMGKNRRIRYEKYEGSICVFLALVLLIIMSLILVMLESAAKSASYSYSQMLLKTATGSVMAEYYGPLFADYHILAIDSGFETKKGDVSEIERRLKKYTGDNVWDYECEEIRVTDAEYLLDESGDEFLEQVAAYEKYAVAQDVVEEFFSRLKNLGNQKKITKIMERKMGIEDELAVIDRKTLELMKLIDGVNLTLGAKTSSVLGYDIEDYFVKKFFVGPNTMTGTGINNPSVYEGLKGRYSDPVQMLADYRLGLSAYSGLLFEISEKRDEIAGLEAEIEGCAKKIEELNRKKEQSEKESKDTGKKKKDKKAEKQTKNDDTEKEIEELKKKITDLDAQITNIRTEIEETEEELEKKFKETEKKSKALCDLIRNVKAELEEVCDIVRDIAKRQEKVKPMVDDFETVLKTLDPILGDDLKTELKDSLEYMKAYVGLGNNKITTTDFDDIGRTAEYDLTVLSEIAGIENYMIFESDSYEDIEAKISNLMGEEEIYRKFSYSGFSFDYSEIKESSIKNELVADFEKNVSEGYLSLFLPDDVKISENEMLSELLPSLWYEVGSNDDEDEGDVTKDADDKGGGELLTDADEGGGLSDIADIVEGGLEKAGKGLLTSMYMRHHFKSYRNRTVEGDTVLDYELEYILSGHETDMANLSAAATKILLLRLPICVIYTLSQKKLKAEAFALAVSIMGFTGLPFLVAIVKYLILFLWALAQATIETAAVMRGKKVPIIPNEKSFCLQLTELPFFSTLVDKKADNFAESEAYLDYDDYLLLLLMLQDKKTQAARAMDVIQENIRYKYNDDFLINNAVTAFSCEAVFMAPYRFMSLAGFAGEGEMYEVKVSDSVAYR